VPSLESLSKPYLPNVTRSTTAPRGKERPRSCTGERHRSADEAEQQRCLEMIIELNIEIARGIAPRYRNKGP
jgi:hypothetical protein